MNSNRYFDAESEMRREADCTRIALLRKEAVCILPTNLSLPSVLALRSSHVAQLFTFCVIKDTRVLGHATQGSQPAYSPHISRGRGRPEPNWSHYPKCPSPSDLFSYNSRKPQWTWLLKLWQGQQWRGRRSEAEREQSFLQQLLGESNLSAVLFGSQLTRISVFE